MSCGYDNSVEQAIEGSFSIDDDGTYVSYQFIEPHQYMCDDISDSYQRIWHWHPIELAPATQYDWLQRRAQAFPGYVWHECAFSTP